MKKLCGMLVFVVSLIGCATDRARDTAEMAIDPNDAKRYTGHSPLRGSIVLGDVALGYEPGTELLANYSTFDGWWHEDGRVQSFRAALNQSLSMTGLLSREPRSGYVLHARVDRGRVDRPWVGQSTYFLPIHYRLVRNSDGREILGETLTGSRQFTRGVAVSAVHDAVRSNMEQLIDRLRRMPVP